MKKMLILLISRFKEPVTLYIWGGLNLAYACIINPIFHISRNSILLTIIGSIVISMGVILDLGKYRVDIVKDVELEKKISHIKSKYWQCVIRNLITFYTEYRSRDMYLCRFYRKTGTVLVVFVDKVDEVKEYMDWYLDENSTTYKTITITSNRVTKIQPNDIEEIEYKKVSWMQRKIINPILGFLRQPIYIISIRGIFVLALLFIFIALGYGYISNEYTFNGYTFMGQGSIETLDFIYEFTKSMLISILSICGIATSIIGIGNIKKGINDLYTNKQVVRKTIFAQLLTFGFVFLGYFIVLKPVMIELIKFTQENGYFMP